MFGTQGLNGTVTSHYFHRIATWLPGTKGWTQVTGTAGVRGAPGWDRPRTWARTLTWPCALFYYPRRGCRGSGHEKEGSRTLSCLCGFPRWAEKANFSVGRYPPPSLSQTCQILKGTTAQKIKNVFLWYLCWSLIFQSPRTRLSSAYPALIQNDLQCKINHASVNTPV